MQFLHDFEKLIAGAKSAVITSHISPDDDSVGSVLAMYWIVKQKYPQLKVQVIYTGEPEKRYDSFAGYSEIKFVDDVANYLDGVDLLICLDGGQLSRFSRLTEKINNFKGKKICIDHHSSPPDQFDLLLELPNKSAVCQIIYEIFGNKVELTREISEGLLLGLLGDTGNFAYLRPSDLNVLDMAKDLLLRLNIQVQEFKSRYDLISQRSFELEKQYVANTKFETLNEWGGFSWSFLPRELVEREHFSDNELSSGAHIYMGSFMRLIEGAPWGFIITPKLDGTCSVSFRSLPKSINVRAMAEAMKIGGGHDLAAGSTFKPINGEKVDPLFCYKKIIEFMQANKPVIS